jgi:hypothetical protein
MNCITCGSDKWVTPNAAEDEEGNTIPLCQGCREVLVQFSLGVIHRPKTAARSIDVEDMSTKELHELAKELGC